MDKMPPIEKIYEAYSAIADSRVSFLESGSAAVVASSDGEKEYTVTWKDGVYTSNDNATYWQGYPGYPVIAVLLLQGKLTLDREIAGLFAGINWAELNKENKRDYAKAVDVVIVERQYDAAKIKAGVKRVFREMEGLSISVKRGPLRPPR